MRRWLPWVALLGGCADPASEWMGEWTGDLMVTISIWGGDETYCEGEIEGDVDETGIIDLTADCLIAYGYAEGDTFEMEATGLVQGEIAYSLTMEWDYDGDNGDREIDDVLFTGDMDEPLEGEEEGEYSSDYGSLDATIWFDISR